MLIDGSLGADSRLSQEERSEEVPRVAASLLESFHAGKGKRLLSDIPLRREIDSLAVDKSLSEDAQAMARELAGETEGLRPLQRRLRLRRALMRFGLSPALSDLVTAGLAVLGLLAYVVGVAVLTAVQGSALWFILFFAFATALTLLGLGLLSLKDRARYWLYDKYYTDEAHRLSRRWLDEERAQGRRFRVQAVKPGKGARIATEDPGAAESREELEDADGRSRPFLPPIQSKD
jgi:hypothetical protein